MKGLDFAGTSELPSQDSFGPRDLSYAEGYETILLENAVCSAHCWISGVLSPGGLRMSVSDSGASDRWAKVERSADGVADHGIARAVQTYYLVYLPVGAAFLIAVGAFLAVPVFELSPEDWPTYLGFGMSIAAVGVIVGGLVYARKRVNPLVRPQRQSALVWLDRSERKGVRDQIFGKVPPVGHHLPALRGIAVQIRQGLAMQLLLAPGYVLLCANQMLLAISRKGFLGFLWLWIPLAILFLALIATALWQFKRTENFLAQTSMTERPEV